MKPIALTVKPVVHDLKCWPDYFAQVKYGIKTFEVRKNDRGFQVNHFLRLKEWDPNTQKYTGHELIKRISFILRGGKFGIDKDHVVMQLKDNPFGPLDAEMMMKDIEYLSLYLPYDLQLLQNCDHWHEPVPSRIVTMCGLYDNGLVSNIHYQESNNNGGSDYVDKFKPLLYPLSMLTEEIEHEGKHIVPIIDLFMMATNEIHFQQVYDYINERNTYGVRFRSNNKLLTFTYNSLFQSFNYSLNKTEALHVGRQWKMFQKLFEWHFDVFNLIQEGKAIDKSKL